MKRKPANAPQHRDQDADLLAGVRLFSSLDAGQLAEIAGESTRVVRLPGQHFFMQGDPTRSLFVLRSGRVKVSQITPAGHQIVVRYAGPGEMFGCAPLYGGSAYPATGEAVIRSEAHAWSRSVMDRLMRQHPSVALNALEQLGEELLDIRSRYRDLATQRVEQRVARALLRLVRQAGRKIDAGVLIDFPVSRQDIAEMTGTTLHTVSRILSGWEHQDIISSGRQRIVIRRPHGLVSIAEDLGDRDS
ncbi:MAG: Crp/Fnr family transcriptional regulator [Acidobacteriota bacterium]